VDIKKDTCKRISMETAYFQIWQLAHRSHICCANLMTSSVSSVITTMIVKEINIEMRNKIVKIKRNICEARTSLQTKRSLFGLKRMGDWIYRSK
jgi:hypothetical protein